MTAQIQQIPRSAIFEAPNNYRKTFNLASLQEMAETMREVGVQQPLKVRPLPMLPEAEHLTYEIVFGHRRFRASGMAGLEFLPCMVEELTDEQADKIRLIENIQREDVSPMEEADGLVLLAEKHNVSAEELGKLVGIGRTSVYDRFKLAKAHPKVREQCHAGAFGSEIAIALAKLPESIQPTAMRKIMTQQPDPEKGPQGTKMIFLSTREAKEKLRQSFTHSLAAGGFDIEHPKLGEAGPCTDCGKCSDNVEALLKDFGPGLCIDADCYETKQVEFVNFRIDQAKRYGAPVLEGEAALKLMPSQWQTYISGDDYQRVSDIQSCVKTAEGTKWLDYHALVELSGQPEPTFTLMRHPHNPKKVVELLTTEQVEALEAHLPKDQSAPVNAAPIKPARRVPPHEVAVADCDSWMRIKLAIMHAAAKGERTVDQLRLIVLALSEHLDSVSLLVAEAMGWPDEDLPTNWSETAGFYAKRATGMDGAELSKLAVLLAIDQAPFHDGHDDDDDDDDDTAGPDWTVTSKLQLAAAYGIDVIEAGKEPPAPPPTPEPAPAADGGNMTLDLGEPDQQDKVQPLLKTLAGKQKVKYRNPATGETWSGRGLQPKWLAAAVASGKKLEDFETGRIKTNDDDAPDDAGLAESDEEARA